MLKKLAAIVVLTALAVSAAGCTVNTKNEGASPSPSLIPDWELAGYIVAYRQTVENYSTNLTTFQVTWVNNTTAHIHTVWTHRLSSNTTNTRSENVTVIKFSSADEAAKYVYIRTSGYSLQSTSYSLNNSSNQYIHRTVSAYKLATGYTPFVYAWYGYGNSSVLTDHGSYGGYAEQDDRYLWLVEYINQN